MTQKRFSKTFASFGDWLTKAPKTGYSKSIQRLHGLYPKASLSQLRRHPTQREAHMGQLSKTPPNKRSWATLTPREKDLRDKSLKVLSQMRRKGQSLTRASREIGISPKTVKQHARAFKKVNGRWKAKRYDRIERRMAINENGREVWVTVKDSRHASLIGRYQSAIREFLQTGDASVLEPFKGKRVRDADGKWHTLETDPKAIYEIQEMREDEEFYTIYER